MALIRFILNWWKHYNAVSNCKRNGHTNVVVVEEYERVTRAKNYRIHRLDGLVRTRPYNEISVHGKLKCRSCGQTYIGNVKVNETQWTP